MIGLLRPRPVEVNSPNSTKNIRILTAEKRKDRKTMTQEKVDFSPGGRLRLSSVSTMQIIGAPQFALCCLNQAPRRNESVAIPCVSLSSANVSSTAEAGQLDRLKAHQELPAHLPHLWWGL